jgi:hypothetical protein
MSEHALSDAQLNLIMERAVKASGPLTKDQLRVLVEWAESVTTDAALLHGLLTGRLDVVVVGIDPNDFIWQAARGVSS